MPVIIVLSAVFGVTCVMGTVVLGLIICKDRCFKLLIATKSADEIAETS